MSIATIQDILDEGFRAPQFGLPDKQAAGWSDPDGYLDRVLRQASRWASEKIGSAYASLVPNSYAGDCTARAETCYVKHVLFKRRVAFLDSSGVAGAGARDVQYLDRREMLAHAESAWQCAQDAIAEAIRATGGDPTETMSGGASFGHVETGRFPLLSGGAA